MRHRERIASALFVTAIGALFICNAYVAGHEGAYYERLQTVELARAK